jgi:hypothetical protein
MEVAPGAWDLLTAYHCSSSIMSERNSGTIKSLILYAPGILDDSVNACLKQWKEASYARAVSFLSGGYKLLPQFFGVKNPRYCKGVKLFFVREGQLTNA